MQPESPLSVKTMKLKNKTCVDHRSQESDCRSSNPSFAMLAVRFWEKCMVFLHASILIYQMGIIRPTSQRTLVSDLEPSALQPRETKIMEKPTSFQ